MHENSVTLVRRGIAGGVFLCLAMMSWLYLVLPEQQAVSFHALAALALVLSAWLVYRNRRVARIQLLLFVLLGAAVLQLIALLNTVVLIEYGQPAMLLLIVGDFAALLIGLMANHRIYGAGIFDVRLLAKRGLLFVERNTMKMGPQVTRTIYDMGDAKSLGILYTAVFVGSMVVAGMSLEAQVTIAAGISIGLSLVSGFVCPIGWSVFAFARDYELETGVPLMVDGFKG